MSRIVDVPPRGVHRKPGEKGRRGEVKHGTWRLGTEKQSNNGNLKLGGCSAEAATPVSSCLRHAGHRQAEIEWWRLTLPAAGK